MFALTVRVSSQKVQVPTSKAKVPNPSSRVKVNNPTSRVKVFNPPANTLHVSIQTSSVNPAHVHAHRDMGRKWNKGDNQRILSKLADMVR